MLTLQSPCWTIDWNTKAVVTGVLNDFRQFIITTTRPTGVGPKYYATTRERTVETYDDECNLTGQMTEHYWVLANWATWAGPEHIVREYESEAEALAAAEAIYVQEILDNNETAIFLDRMTAERVLSEMEEE